MYNACNVLEEPESSISMKAELRNLICVVLKNTSEDIHDVHISYHLTSSRKAVILFTFLSFPFFSFLPFFLSFFLSFIFCFFLSFFLFLLFPFLLFPFLLFPFLLFPFLLFPFLLFPFLLFSFLLFSFL